MKSHLWALLEECTLVHKEYRYDTGDATGYSRDAEASRRTRHPTSVAGGAWEHVTMKEKIPGLCMWAWSSACPRPPHEGRSKIQQVVCSPARPRPPRSDMGG